MEQLKQCPNCGTASCTGCIALLCAAGPEEPDWDKDPDFRNRNKDRAGPDSDHDPDSYTSRNSWELPDDFDGNVN